jgi:uncharacterized protein YcfL
MFKFKKRNNSEESSTEPAKKHHHSKAFEWALGVLAVAALVVAALAAYWAFGSGNSAAPVAKTNPKTQTKASKSNPQKPYYSSWKTYCDGTYHFCFRYPKSGWNLTAKSSPKAVTVKGGSKASVTGVSAKLTNKDKNVTITYTNPQALPQKHSKKPPKKKSPQSHIKTQAFLVTSLTKTYKTNVPFKIVGRVATKNHMPSYSVADPGFVKAFKVKAGQTMQLPNKLLFANITASEHGTRSASLEAVPTGKFASTAKAKAWFKTPQAKTALKILRSTGYNPKSK